MRNTVRKVIVYPSGSATMVTIHRTGREPRKMVGKRVDTVLGILSNGTWQSTISVVDNREIGEGFKIQAITYRPMELSESGYREVLRMVYEWFLGNVDGFLEGQDRADYFWHLLGAIVAKPGEHWTREDHKESFFLELEATASGQRWPKAITTAWRSFFREKR